MSTACAVTTDYLIKLTAHDTRDPISFLPFFDCRITIPGDMAGVVAIFLAIHSIEIWPNSKLFVFIYTANYTRAHYHAWRLVIELVMRKRHNAHIMLWSWPRMRITNSINTTFYYAGM